MKISRRKIEIVFISYKASMSDSILSIYIAAKNDQDCNAVWLPVPYYERKPDGSYGAMRYEGTSYYNDDVECTDWQQYDIEARRPDVIFTFAPYDDSNYVTSVHPNFYCKRLRKLTGLLVYTPYFVPFGDLPEHLAAVPGCIYAHKVVVESEKVRKSYIKAFKKEYGDMLGKPEDKFIALGSPKYDAVIQAKRGDYKLPDVWLELIVNKKVVLYNTSIGAILTNNKRYLNKLRSVFEIFRQHQDAVLWWRPHPLSEATLKSMRPRLLDEYMEIVACYKREKFGIYDDSTDFHRAIVYSDAYYGDISSVTALYQITNKPILIQNIESMRRVLIDSRHREISDLADRLSENYFKWIYLNSLCQVDGAYYFASNIDCRLFRLRLSDMIAEYVCNLPDEGDTVYNLYGDAVLYKAKIYFAPRAARNVAVYDTKSGETEKIPIPFNLAMYCGKTKAYIVNNKFSAICVYSDKIFIIPLYYLGIIVLDTKTNSIKVIDNWLDSYYKLVTKHMNNAIGSLRKIVISPSINAFVSQSANIVFFLDMESESVTMREVGVKGDVFRAACFDGDNIWIVSHLVFLNEHRADMGYPVGFHIYKYNIESDRYDDIDLSSMNIRLHEKLYDFESALYYDGFVYLCPAANDLFLKIDCVSNEISVISEFDAEINYITEDKNCCRNFSMAQLIDNKIYAFGYKSKTMYYYDPHTGEMQSKKLTFNADSLKSVIEKQQIEQIAKTRIMYEPWMDLPTMLKMMKDGCFSYDITAQEADSGKRIYQYIRNIALN